MLKSSKKSIDMTEGPILLKMLRYAIPMALSTIIQLSFVSADMIVIGRFSGSESLAAVGASGTVAGVLICLFTGFSAGASVAAARAIGAKNKQVASKIAHTTVLLGFLVGTLILIAGMIFSRKLLIIMSTPEEILDKALIYLRIYLLGMPAMMTHNLASGLLRAEGKTQKPVIYNLIAGPVNVILNLITVLVFKMDVAGVALATLAAEHVACILLVRGLIKDEGMLKIDIKKLKLTKFAVKDIMRVGVPSSLSGVVDRFAGTILQTAINSLGVTVITGSVAAGNIEGFLVTIFNAVCDAVLSFSTQNHGAGKLKRIDKACISGIVIVVALGIIVWLIVHFFGESLISLYVTEPAAIAEGMIRLKYTAGFYAIAYIPSVIAAVLRGTGYAVLPTAISTFISCGLRVLWIIFIFPIERTSSMLYVSYPVLWVLATIVYLIVHSITRKKLYKAFGMNPKAKEE